jgi:hypothetical protein
MNTKIIGILAIALCSTVGAFATPDGMRGASAVQLNNRLAASVSVTKDAEANIISFHVNGISASDADILIKKFPSPLSTEYTVITGLNKEGASTTYMLPTNIATAQVVESISQDLVNAGAINIEITKQTTGQTAKA